MLVKADHYKNYRGWWPWPNFTPGEMADRKDGSLMIESDFMDWLQRVRDAYGYPMTISSGYRTPKHQQSLPGGRSTGSHVSGEAIDVLVWGERAHKLQKVAYAHGVAGVGVHLAGPYPKRYVHLDRWTKFPQGVRPSSWSYLK